MRLRRLFVSEQQGEAFVQLIFEEGDPWRLLFAMELFERWVIGANDIERRQFVEREVWGRLRDREQPTTLDRSRKTHMGPRLATTPQGVRLDPRPVPEQPKRVAISKS